MMNGLCDKIKALLEKKYKALKEFGLDPEQSKKMNTDPVKLAFIEKIKAGWRTLKWSTGCMNKS